MVTVKKYYILDLHIALNSFLCHYNMAFITQIAEC